MNKRLNVFIPAAGLGERLRPITYRIPKPLLHILGKSVLGLVLEKVIALCPDSIAINLHYKGERIKDYINGSPFKDKLKFFHEDPILGTGGALKNAEGLLCDGTLLVHNSDIISDIDLKALLDFHYSSRNMATLAVHDYPCFNNVVIDETGCFKGIDSLSKNQNVKAFTGIAVYEPEFLRFLPSGISSVVDAWIKAIDAGYKIGTMDVTGCCWTDIGSPAAYASAVIDALRAGGETVYIHPSAKECANIELDGYISIEAGCVFSEGSSLRNCIVLQGSRTDKKDYENCIIGPDFEIRLSESEMLGTADNNRLILIGTGGSDRKYYRVRKGDSTHVFVKYGKDDPDFKRHIEYTRFFRRHDIPVPELIDVNIDDMTALFEDLGDVSLYSWLKWLRDSGQIEKIYRKVIDIAVLIHTAATQNVSECRCLQERIFDYEHFRWESDYFIERFIKPIKRITIEDMPELDEEFHRLALKADSYQKTIIHRDFQSQNIMIAKGDVPRVIDYQGARIGPPAYDIASMLWDPYFRLSGDMRERLLEYYVNQIENMLNEKDLIESLLLCRIQRHMQALGAYGFLSLVKGKKYFLKHIPEGLRLLKENSILLKEKYPMLHKLIAGL